MKRKAKQRVLAILMAMLIVLSLFPSANLSAYAVTEEEWLADWTEVNQYGAFISEEVTLYQNPSDTNTTVTTSKDALPGTFTVQYSYCDEVLWYLIDTENWDESYGHDSSYGYVNAEDVILLGDTETSIVNTVTVNDSTVPVSVSGTLPENAILNLTAISVGDLTDFTLTAGEYALAMDISITTDDQEWQPDEGEMLTVSIPAAILGINSNDCFWVYHIHDDNTDILGPFTNDGVTATFTIDGFSSLVFSIAEDGYSYTSAKLNVESVDLYLNPFNMDAATAASFITFDASELPETFNIMYALEDSEGTVWYLLDVESWGEDLAYWDKITDPAQPYSYVKAEYVDVVEPDDAVNMEVLPYGFMLNVDDVSYNQYTAVKNGLVTGSEFRDWQNTYLFGYDITPVDENGNVYQPITDGEAVTVYIADAYDTSWDFPIVEVYHILENDTAVEAAISNGTIRWCTDLAVVAAYKDIAQSIDGVLSVPYVVLSTANGLVTLCEDGGIRFETDSFSDYYVMTSDGVPVVLTGTSTSGSTALEYNIYMLAGTSATLKVGATSGITINNHNDYAENSAGVKISEGVADADSTDYTITVSSSASTSTSAAATYTFAFSQIIENTSRTFNATVNVYVYGQDGIDSYIQAAYNANSVGHIQLNVDTIIVMINGVAVDSLTDLNMHYSSANSGTPVKMDDDSDVGYYYIYSYTTSVTYTGADGNSVTEDIETNISIRIDETSLPDFMFDDNGAIRNEYLEALKKWSFTSVGIDSSQNQIDFEGTVPVGTMQYPIEYIVTVETTYTGSNSKYVGKEMTFTDTIGFWDLDNVCPGVGNGEDEYYMEDRKAEWQSGAVTSYNPGIDIAKFSTGYTDAEGNTYYVIYNDLTKIVHSFDFADTNTVSSRTYSFTIYRRPEGSTDSSAWMAVDTISATISANDKQADGTYKLVTSLNTSADKYYGYLNGYEYMIAETGYSIAGYDCETVFTIGGTTGTGNSTLFNWTVNELLVYSYESAATTEDNGSTTTKTYTYTKDSDGKVSLETIESNVYTTTTTTTSGGTDSTTTETTTNSDGSVTVTTTTITYAQSGGNRPQRPGSSTGYTKTTVITTVITKTESLTAFPTEYESAATKTYVYYAEIQCDNTYSQLDAGLTIEKKLTDANGKVVNSSDYFEVIITPSELTSENGKTDFNGKTFTYSINGTGSYAVTASSPSSGYGSITIYIKAGDVINFTALPVGTYTVKETNEVYYADNSGTGAVTDVEATAAGITTPAKYLYDTKTYTLTLSEKITGAKVTLSNTSTAPTTYNLTIIKEVKDNKTYDVSDIFIFDVVITGVDGTVIELTVSLKAGESVTIVEIPAGSEYSVTERTSWRYTTTSDGSSVGKLNEDKSTTFTNELTDDQYLTDTSVVTNEFAVIEDETIVSQVTTTYNNDGSSAVTTVIYDSNGIKASTTKKYDVNGNEITDDLDN